MKKAIIIGILLLVGFAITQGYLHKIDKPTTILGWVKARGDIYSFSNGRYDLGKYNLWWDTTWTEHGQFRDILIWASDSTDTTQITPTKITVDSIDIDNLVASTGRTATITVAASNSSADAKSQADYVCGTDTLQTAVDALPDSGASLFMFAGDYEDSIKINGKKNISIYGEGWATRLKTPDSTHTCPLRITNSELVKIADLQIDGNFANNDTMGGEWIQSALSCSTTNELTIDNVYAHHAPFMGVSVWACSTYRVINGNFSKNGFKGISTWRSCWGLIQGNQIDSNGVLITQDDGICCHATDHKVRIIGNSLMGNYRSNINCGAYESVIADNYCNGSVLGPGIYFLAAGSGIISGNTCTDNNTYGIYVSSSSPVGAVISDNICEEQRYDGIIAEGTNHLINGNLCRRNNKTESSGYSGIRLHNAKNCYVANNKCFDDDDLEQDYGIRETGTSDSNFIAFNDVRLNKTAGILTAGDSTTTYMNIDSVGRAKIDCAFIADEVKSDVLIQNMLIGGSTHQSYTSVNQNSSGYIYSSLMGCMSPDSITLDSMKVVYYNDDDTNYVTSCDIDVYFDLDDYQASQIWVDNTDAGVDSSLWYRHTYNGINTKIAPWDVFRIGVTGASMAANNDVRVNQCVWFLSY